MAAESESGGSSGVAIESPSSSSSPTASTPLILPLSSIYPINTHMELTLLLVDNNCKNADNNNNIVRGTIYCTDEISNTIVLKNSLVHTTLSSEIKVINAAIVTGRRFIKDDNLSSFSEGDRDSGDYCTEDAQSLGVENSNDEEEEKILPNVSRRMVEERERRAIKLMEESFSQVNQKATPEGQKIFDKLLKACNQVVWDGESIIVLGEIRVSPPYTSNECVLLKKGGGQGLDGHSLERVKNIVNAASK